MPDLGKPLAHSLDSVAEDSNDDERWSEARDEQNNVVGGDQGDSLSAA